MDGTRAALRTRPTTDLLRADVRPRTSTRSSRRSPEEPIGRLERWSRAGRAKPCSPRSPGIVTGVAYDPADRTLWVVRTPGKRMAEVAGLPTGWPPARLGRIAGRQELPHGGGRCGVRAAGRRVVVQPHLAPPRGVAAMKTATLQAWMDEHGPLGPHEAALIALGCLSP